MFSCFVQCNLTYKFFFLLGDSVLQNDSVKTQNELTGLILNV